MLTAPAPTANQTNVLDVCGRLKQFGAQYLLGHALKEIRPDGVVLERLADHADVSVAADAVVLSLGYRPDHGITSFKSEGRKTVCHPAPSYGRARRSDRLCTGKSRKKFRNTFKTIQNCLEFVLYFSGPV